MADGENDISGFLAWDEDLPRLRWDLVNSWVESREAHSRWAAWDVACGGWLRALAAALNGDYHVIESDHFRLLAAKADGHGDVLLRHAESCRTRLLTGLGGVASFEGAGDRTAVVALRTHADYYQYISPFYPEGQHGGSAGVHIREGLPHVALCGTQLWALENTLAHELTHASLHHLTMPQWLEEGLAQMFEHDMTGRLLLEVDEEMAARHKRYWGKRGMDGFWRGESFSRPGKVQELSYQLAEILVRLLVEDAKPGWFGWGRGRQGQFFAFLRSAGAGDCGEAACREHLGCPLRDLAARFLGPSASPPGP